MSMIERVARAQAEAIFGKGCPLDDDDYVRARAAIEAMREPTDAMVDVMNDVVIDGPDYVDFHPSMADCATIFTAGIEAALSEQPSC